MSDNRDTYIEKYLIPEILSKLDNEELISYAAKHSTGLDGFMSTLYNIELKTKTEQGTKNRLLIVKFMRGDADFRESSKSYIQFANEIYIYGTVLPAYENMLKELQFNDVKITDLVAPSFVSRFGYIEGLSTKPNEREAVLVLENLKPFGYEMGPRLSLNKDHLLAMCKPVGYHHAFSYALRALEPNRAAKLEAGIITLPFINDEDPKDATNNLYRILYRIGFDRFYEYFERILDSSVTFDKQSELDLKLIESIKRLKAKYFEEPTRLLESIRTKVFLNDEDKPFAAILHGDYNRNNVLFKYKRTADNQNVEDKNSLKVEDIKMIDFQELRFASPVLDLSFFMYFNTPEEIRSTVWMDVLHSYHTTMFSTLEKLLKKSKKSEKEINEILASYSFEKFHNHFKRLAFYGVIICFHFLPWMLCTEEECSRLSELFENDLHGEEFRKLSIEAGGDEVNHRILNVLRHACKMGYMDDL